MTTINVQLLMTGNEIMCGDVVDSNSAMIAQQLKELGLEVKRKTAVGDSLPALIQEINDISQQADILLINGGLGPTVDDLTAQALAACAGQSLQFHPDAMAHLEHWCQLRGFTLNEPNKKQALLPEHCSIIANPVGSAVGFKLRLHQCDIYCTPGVPSELKVMLTHEIMPEVARRIPDELKTEVQRWQVFGIGESTLQAMIDEQFPDWPEQIEVGFRAALPLLEVKLTSRGHQAGELKKRWAPKLRQMLGAHIIGDNNTNLAQTLVTGLSERQQKITTAESCTGGLMASQLTQVPGSSQVFEAGFVTYSNEMKTTMLNVAPETLQRHGAVSEPVVLAMLDGALATSGADYGIAVSGVAGPDGGSEEKPVGMVWLAWGSRQIRHSVCLYFPGNRYYFQHYVAAAGLDLVRRLMQENDEMPLYLSQRKFKNS